MLNILYISLFPPTPNDPAAGGKLAYFYVEKLNNNENINLNVICSIPRTNKEFWDISTKKFNGIYFNEPEQKLIKRIKSKFYINYGGYFQIEHVKLFINSAIELKQNGFYPNYIIFDWESTAYIFKDIKKIFPNANYSVVEQDVISQSFYRFYKSTINPIKKIYKYYMFKNCLRLEKKIFKQFDYITVLSKKDFDLVKKIYKKAIINVIAPFYNNYNSFKLNKNKTNDILFFGYMKRIENQEAVKWFIDNIMPQMIDCRFVIIGGGIPDSLKKINKPNILITGFQTEQEIKTWFKNSLCMIAPLIHGAGVKIKVLEAMSAGIPVLTNEIGIEGIPANNGKEYLFCKEKEDYIRNIYKLINNKDLCIEIGENSRNMLKNNFNFDQSSYLKF